MTESETKRLQYQISVMQGVLDGKEVEISMEPWGFVWCKCINPSWDWDNYDYRLKPEVVKYRRYLWKDRYSELIVVYTVSPKEDTVEPEKHPRFIRWIDTEWQEVEV